MTKLKKLIERKSAPAQRSACRLDLLSNRTLCLCALIFSAAILYTATSAPLVSADTIVLNGTKTTSGTVSSPYQITLSNFNVGTGSNRVLIVGIEANNAQASTVKFGGVSLTPAVSHFIWNDAEFWYLKNPNGTANIVVTMYGSTSVVVGAYSFFGVDQTNPIPTTVGKNNTAPSSPSISITTANSNSWVLDSPSIYGGITLSSPTCTQRWDINIASAITGASSSKTTTSPGSVTCSWTASTGDYWDDVAIEVKAAGATVPGAPTNLLTTAVSSSQINLSWTAPSNNGGSSITGYKIDRSLGTPNGCPPIPQWTTIVANTGNTATTYSNTGLSQGQYYCYQVSAINSVGTGSPSNDNQAFTFTVPYPPVNLTAAAVSSSQINLSWVFCPPPHAPGSHCTGGTSVTGYKIERSLNGGNTWSTIVANNGNNSTTTYSDTGLSASTTYTYRVSAINSVGSSNPSNTASATTSASSSWRHTSTGILEPLYLDPYTTTPCNQASCFAWKLVNASEIQHPHVPIFAIVNPGNDRFPGGGPGSPPGPNGCAYEALYPGNRTRDYDNAIGNLTNQGVTVLGYIDSNPLPGNPDTTNLNLVEGNVTVWQQCYPKIQGIFLDVMPNNVDGYESYYSSITNYIHNTAHLQFSFGNPGADTYKGYQGKVDLMNIYEGYNETGNKLTNATLQGNTPITGNPANWHTNNDKSTYSLLLFNEALQTQKWVQGKSVYVSFMFITNDNLPNPWDTVPSYLSTLAGYLDNPSVLLTIKSLNMSNSAQLTEPLQINQSKNLVRNGTATLIYNATQGWQFAITAKNMCPYTFDHWDDGSHAASRTVTAPSTNTIYTAYYNKTC